MTTHVHSRIRWGHRSRWRHRLRHGIAGFALILASLVCFWLLVRSCEAGLPY